MSILIKGMEMPKCCEECVAGAYEYNDNDERCFVCGFIKSQHPWECEHVEIDGIDTTKARADFCPLIEVHTPHGDLVDRNKLLRKAKRESTYAWKMNLHARTETILNQFIDWLDAEKAVIEAEE